MGFRVFFYALYSNASNANVYILWGCTLNTVNYDYVQRDDLIRILLLLLVVFIQTSVSQPFGTTAHISH